MKEIGGYFELELNEGAEYHNNSIRLNTGRNALEYILLANNYNKIYLPFFICDSLLEPLRRHDIEVDFYLIDDQFEPIFDFSTIEDASGFLYVNYFGLKDSFVHSLKQKCKNLIVDNSQSFFSKPEPNTDTFYSARKFFGVPDGAYLYTNKPLPFPLDMDQSYNRCLHLLMRKDIGPQPGYGSFLQNEHYLCNQQIKKMSRLTQAILCNINYEKIRKRRIENFNFIHENIASTNKLKLSTDAVYSPMVYPYWCTDKGLKDRLHKNKIFTATYWDDVKKRRTADSLEYKFTEEIVYLPIDQRLTKRNVALILKIIRNEYSG
mgnify:FL=1